MPTRAPTSPLRRPSAGARRLAVVLTFTCAFASALALWFAPAAGATTARATVATSSNWSGYAVHAPGVSFTRARGTWTLPRDRCSPGSSTYSATWVGIGGYALDARALEQIGTETDCTRSGRRITSAWYEIVPAPTRRLSLAVRAGDTMTATVTVIGRHVTLTLRDVTRGRSATKTLTPRVTDVSSAEWIVEAPEQCESATDCHTLPLADFGTVRFRDAQAWDAAGAEGSISSRDWVRTKITLTQAGSVRFVSGHQGAGEAVPGALDSSGAGFRVAYTESAGGPSASVARMGVRAGAVAGRVQPGGRRG